MFDFEDYENLSDYEFTYPAFEVLQHTYNVALKRKEVSLPACSFQDWIIRHTKFRIKHGYRKYREVEPEWVTLYDYIVEIASTDHRYDLPLVATGAAQLVVGDYLIYQNGTTSNAFYRRPISSSFATTATNTITSLQSSKKSLFTYNGYLYIQKNISTFYAYNPTTFSAVSGQHITITNCNMPAKMQTAFTTNSTSTYAAITQVGENYLIQDAVNGFGIICSDPTDVLGTLIKIVPRSYFYNSCVVNGTNLYFYGYSGKFFGGKTTATYPTASGTVLG